MRTTALGIIRHTFVTSLYQLEEHIKDGWRVYSIHPLGEHTNRYEFDLYKPVEEDQ